MSNQQPANISNNLRLGIEAARTGRENEARTHFIAVLKQDPNNIPAMLWLAFVLPAPQDTIRLLKRVLALDPENERAKAGIRWARVRLGLPPEQSEPVAPESPAPAVQVEAAPPEESGEDSIRSLLLSEEVQQRSKKGALAHRARRTINPFLGIFLISGALGLIAIGLGALLFVPPETLAAWIPVAYRNSPTQTDIQPVDRNSAPAEVAVPLTVAPKTVAKSFSSAADTIIIPEPPPHIYQPPAESDLAVPVKKDDPTPTASTAPEETQATSIQPLELIGPIGPFVPEPVDKALLVHQPAYPGEKWIEVNVTTQKVTAWEGDVPVMEFTVSTGLPNTPTVLGKFNIYWKLKSTLMVGADYYLPEVPYTMYFYAGYALHGTYWHSNFGQPMSHGCVNLETSQAQQIFEWANPILPPGQTEVVASTDNPGTLVVVHE